jgi:hypothetical protein
VPVEPFLGALLVLGIFSYAAATNFSVESGTQFNWDSQAPLIDEWEKAYKNGLEVEGVRIPINLPPWELQLPANYLRK